MSSESQQTILAPESFPHLSEVEWNAFQRMRDSVGESIVVSILRTFPPEQQKSAVLSFMDEEIKSAKRQSTTPVASRGATSLKLEVSPYHGTEHEPLLRWFVELDASIEARLLKEEGQQVAFAMSKLSGRAKSWAFGRRLADPFCFPTYSEFKEELKATFEPPKCEFRARAEFLDLRQGRMGLHEYAEQARYLVSSVVSEPIDEATQVVTFMKGLNDGPIRTHLFREYPTDLNTAISLALQEEFSHKQARHQPRTHQFPVRPRRSEISNGPEPMDISYASETRTRNQKPRPYSSGGRSGAPTAVSNVKCFRCDRMGHFARNCRVTPRNTRWSPGMRSSSQGRSPVQDNNARRQSENGNDQ